MKKLVILTMIIGMLVSGCHMYWKPDELLSQCISDELFCRERALDKCNVATPGNVTSYRYDECVHSYYIVCMNKKGYTQSRWGNCPIPNELSW